MPALNIHTHRSQTFLIHPVLRRAESCRRPGESTILTECPTSPWRRATVVQKKHVWNPSFLSVITCPLSKTFHFFLPSPFIFQGLQTILSPFKFFSILQILLDMYSFITYYLAFRTSSWCLLMPIQFLSGLKFEKKNCLPCFISHLDWNENIMRSLKTRLLKYGLHLTDHRNNKRSKDNI